MPDLLKPYYDTEGPLGFPMKDRQARALDSLLKALPKEKAYEYRRSAKAGPSSEVNPGERSDVSWISTEALDRANEVVLARGMSDAQFQLNPVVTLNHCYGGPPVGRSLWRKFTRDGAVRGVKAKTQYPAAPASWPAAEPWGPDKVFALVQAGLLNGKSIGFLPLKVHFPDQAEAGKNGWPADTLVIDEWLLLEYAVCTFGVNQDALVESVSKSGVVPFTPLEEIEKALAQRLERIDLAQLVQDCFDRRRGRV